MTATGRAAIKQYERMRAGCRFGTRRPHAVFTERDVGARVQAGQQQFARQRTNVCVKIPLLGSNRSKASSEPRCDGSAHETAAVRRIDNRKVRRLRRQDAAHFYDVARYGGTPVAARGRHRAPAEETRRAACAAADC